MSRTREQREEDLHLEEAIMEMVAVEMGEQELDPSQETVMRVDMPDITAMRLGLGVTQQDFADMFGIKVGTLRNWEQGRRRPNAAARILFEVFRREPQAVLRALRTVEARSGRR